MSLPLTPQEISLFSRYGNNNFTTDAFNSMPFLNEKGFFTPVHYQNQDELNNKKHRRNAGDYRNTHSDHRRLHQRMNVHTSELKAQTPFM